MHSSRPTLTWIIDGFIAILFLALLWRLYAPLADSQFQTIETVELESITVEHIIRELHEHAETLPEEKRKALLEELEKAESERDHLLEMMETAQELDDTLSQMAIQIWSTLTPQEQMRIRTERNRISVEQIERTVWEQTKENLEAE